MWVQEVISSIVGCYSARVDDLDNPSLQAQLATDTIFEAMAAALTHGSAVQAGQLTEETGKHPGMPCPKGLHINTPVPTHSCASALHSAFKLVDSLCKRCMLQECAP